MTNEEFYENKYKRIDEVLETLRQTIIQKLKTATTPEETEAVAALVEQFFKLSTACW